MPTRSRLLRLLIPLLVVLLVGPPALAEGATPSRKKAIWGPVRVDGASQFPIYRELGAGIYQYALRWSDVATARPADPRNPDDPAYQWPEELDFAAGEAARYGIQMSLMVLKTPGWANGGQPGNAPPINPKDYADFLEAAAKRYPRVRHWMVWGEPIRFPNFLIHFGYPKQRLDNGRLDAVQRVDARKYAELVDAAYGRLKRLSRRNLVIGGNTTTIGDWFSPEQWMRGLRLKDGRPPRMDLYGHNPFGSRGPDLRKKQVTPGTADFSDLDVLAGWIDRYLDRRGRNRNVKIFVSEYTAPTDVESYEFNYHVTRAVQAKWLAAAMRISRRWPRIYTLGWIGLRDAAPRAEDGKETRTGLIDRQGRRKPAFKAFQRG